LSLRFQVIGGGLAGTEVAWTLARFGFPVDLYEMRSVRTTPAHKTDGLAELVCSNSFRSRSATKAVGILKNEMVSLKSLTMEAATLAQIPAGDALAVDREIFSSIITERIEKSPRIKVHRQEITALEPLLQKGPVVVATGPLTSSSLHKALTPFVGPQDLYFYDAISPIVDASTLRMEVIFSASRYGKGEGEDYLNCPLSEEEYDQFIFQLRKAQR